MAKLSGTDYFKVLLVAVAVLFIASKVISYTGIGETFDISQIGQIAQGNFIWQLLIGMTLIYFLVWVFGKTEGGINVKTFGSIVLLMFILYIVVYVLDRTFKIGVGIPWMFGADWVGSVIPIP